MSSDSRTAYVTNELSNSVSVVDLAGRRVTATIPVGNAPRKIAVQPGPAETGWGPDVTRRWAFLTASLRTPVARAATRLITAGGREFSDHGTAVVTDRFKVDVEADSYYFAPTFLRGKPGQKLMLEIENDSGTLHNISIAELNLDKNIPPKSKVTVEVTFPQAGALHFFCKFHTAIGMNGALLVGDATP